MDPKRIEIEIRDADGMILAGAERPMEFAYTEGLRYATLNRNEEPVVIQEVTRREVEYGELVEKASVTYYPIPDDYAPSMVTLETKTDELTRLLSARKWMAAMKLASTLSAAARKVTEICIDQLVQEVTHAVRPVEGDDANLR